MQSVDLAAADADPEKLAKEDPLATQVWKMYARQKATLPHAQRMENLTWRMMALALKKKKEDEGRERAQDDALGPARRGFVGFISGGCWLWRHSVRIEMRRRDERRMSDLDARLLRRGPGGRHEAEDEHERRTVRARSYIVDGHDA